MPCKVVSLGPREQGQAVIRGLRDGWCSLLSVLGKVVGEHTNIHLLSWVLRRNT